MLCGGSIGLQANTVTLASGVPLEFPAPPSLQILAIARYRCGLRLVWHENPSLLYVPSRMKHYTRYRCAEYKRGNARRSAANQEVKPASGRLQLLVLARRLLGGIAANPDRSGDRQ